MSLEPHWFSTIYGMIFMVTEALAAMAVVTVTVILLSKQKPLAGLGFAAGAGRLRQPAADLHHVVGVPLVFAVLDYLGGKPAGRNSLVHEPARGGAGRGWRWS